MPLRLVLGPANARKVGALLDAHERAAGAGRTAWFVVPSSGDVERFQRELAGLDGPPGHAPRTASPFGQVMVGLGLEQRLLARLGDGRELLAADHRRAVALAAVRTTRLTALQPAARSGWLAPEVVSLAEELATTGDLGGPAEAALGAWSAATADPRGDELASLLRADARLLAQLATDPAIRRVDRAQAARTVAEALRRRPEALRGFHVVLSGFDDLDPVQRSLVLAVARSAAEVVVSLPFQAGREALAAASGLVDYLAAADPEIVDLAGSPADAPTAAPLAGVEQRLFEQVVFEAPAAPVHDPFAPRGPTDPAVLGPLVPAYADGHEEEEVPTVHAAHGEAPGAGRGAARLVAGDAASLDGAAVVELRGGGPDEEAALIAEHLVAAVAAGRAPDRMAVVVSQPARQGRALLAALERAGLPAHLVAPVPARAWPSVAALLALLRATADDGGAGHLVDWLAGPGGPAGADALDATVRRRGASSAREALRIWRGHGHGELPEVRALWDAQRRQAAPGALERAATAALRQRTLALTSTPGLPTPAMQRDLRAAGRILELLDELVALVERAPALGLGLGELHDLIAQTPSPQEPEPTASIAVVGPLGVRTRHLELVVVARAQRGSYPAAEPVRRALTRADRAALTGHGWPVPARPEHALSQRYLAYEVVARPTVQLVLAWHDGDGDGKPCEPSPLLSEVRRAAGGEALVPLRTLPSGSAARHALRPARRERIQAARLGPRHREPSPSQSPLLAAQPRDHYSVGALQTASRCPAQWFVDHHLRPQPLSPDAAPLTAGRLRHELLAEVVRACVVGGQPLEPAALPRLQEALAAAAARLVARAAERDETLAERLMRDRVVAEIEATLPALCGEGRLAHQPQEFELAFGTRRAPAPGTSSTVGDGDEEADELRPPVVVERGGERLVLAGRIDRLDVAGDGELVVVDYKGANVDQYRGAGWIERRELQAGLYALVAERLVGEGSRAVASLYQPVPGPLEQAARGAACSALPGRTPLSRHDALSGDEWDALLDALVGLAADAQRLIDDGIVAPAPGGCSAGGCRYPWLCREVQS